MKFSTVVIAKNEEKTLPKLLKSLEGVDEIVVCDTGSQDKTIKVARSLGAKVFEKRFDIIIDEGLKKKIDELIGENDIKVGDRAFNFADARNWAVTKAKNDMIFMPDCDEVVEWDLKEVEKLLDTGIDRLEYNFVFSWDAEGNPLIQFIHSKFYNRKKLKWVRNIHEVLAGEGKSQFTDKIFLKHYQNYETNRGQYLKGLAIDYIQNPYNDRNCHYFARELLYSKKYKESIKIFEQHIENPGWNTEKGQSLIFMGDCYKALGNEQKAMECYARGFTYDMNRREALLAMAQVKYSNQQWAEAGRLYWMAILIPKGNYYANWALNYGHYPWGQLSVCLFHQGKFGQSYECLKKALEFDPKNQTYLNNLKFYSGMERVNIKGKIGPVEKEHISRYKWATQFTEGRDVIDVACGNGYGYDFLKAKKYRGYDKSEEAIKFAKGNYGGEYYLIDLEKEILPSAEVIVCFETIEHLENPDFFLQNLNADLIIISTPILERRGSNPYHKQVWTREEIKLLLEKYFKCEYFFQDKEIIDKIDVNPQYLITLCRKKENIEKTGFDIKLSAVINFKDKVDLTRNAIESLIQNTKSLGEIIIIDDGSTEDFKPHLEDLKKHSIPIICRTTEENNRGVCQAWNLGISLATLPYVVVLNNDLLFSPDWDQPLLNALDDDVWIVSPYHTAGDKLPKDFPRGRDRHTNLAIGVGLPFIGSCFMMKKETLDRIGPIDNRLKIWCGDNYLWESVVVDFGKQVKEIPESYIHHFCAQTTKDIPRSILGKDIETFDTICMERNWRNRKKSYNVIPLIDLRLKLPIKDLYKMKVLNVGIGDGNSGLAKQLPYLNFKQLDNIDIHQPYLDEAKKLEWTCRNVNFINADVRNFDLSGYDLIMIFDVLEHLEKNDALKILDRAEKSNAKIFIFTPLEKEFRENIFNVESEDHKSFWSEKDFIERGYKTELLPRFHRYGSAFWAIK